MNLGTWPAPARVVIRTFTFSVTSSPDGVGTPDVPLSLRAGLGGNTPIHFSNDNFSKLKEAGWITEEEKVEGLSVGGPIHSRSGTMQSGSKF